MGLPDLPDENDNPSLYSQTSFPIFIQNNTSDESDHEIRDDIYNGYEPLGIGQNVPSANDDDDDDDDDHEDNNAWVAFQDKEPESNPEPKVPSPDAEIEREVWSAPRPVELNIELDTEKTQQILSAMAGISLPKAVIPDWAQEIPEEKWKEDLLFKIREKSTLSSPNIE